jgi:hypothetical protein
MTTGTVIDLATNTVTTVDLPEPTPVVPNAVTARQARLALLGAGLLDDVEAALDALTGAQGTAARIEWEYALEIRRDSPLIASLTPSLSLTAEQVNDLFIAAQLL